MSNPKRTAGLIVAIVLLAPIVVGLAGVAFYYVYVPTWRLFLGFEGFWVPAAVLVIGAGVSSVINLPTGIRAAGRGYYLNLLGFAGPIVVAVYAGTQIRPSLAWHHVVAWLLCTALYFRGTWGFEQGVRVSGLVIQIVAIALIAYQYYLAGLPVREVMWWGYTLQYASLVVPDVYRAFADTSKFGSQVTKLTVGGAGARDALWTAPLTVLTYCFFAQWLLWGGLDAGK